VYEAQKPLVDKLLEKVDNLFVYRHFHGKNCGEVFEELIGFIFF
jgi:hypothetical protein